jgi:Rieske Fe-S protein
LAIALPDVPTSLDTSYSPARRRALSLFVNSVIAVTGGALSALLGVFALRPSVTAGGERWLRAGPVTDLVPDVPVPRVLSVPATDGWYRARTRATVFLVWDGAREVRALSATCTHLGCQVRWEGETDRFICPCHGGAYAADGRVLDGPPPRPLDTIRARVDDSGDTVLVQL